LDYNATTPLSAEVQSAIKGCFDHFGNPSSGHVYGQQAKKDVETARLQVSTLLGCDSDELIFTSGGTESNNFAIKGVAFSQEARGKHIITSAVEHPAVTEVCKYLTAKGFEITYLPVDELGRVSPADLEAAITDRTTLVSVMHSNNEVGTLQPIAELAAIAHRHGALFHTDASQSIGKVPVNVRTLGVDLLTVAGHKCYAPKGVGALFARRGVALEKFMHGAGHESGRRPGTENILGMVGLGAACELSHRLLPEHAANMRRTRDLMLQLLRERIPSARRNGDPDHCLPNTLSVSFRGVSAHKLIASVQQRVAVSGGAACHDGSTTVSHVLSSMRVPLEFATGTVRISTGRATTDADIRTAADVLSDAVSKS